MSKVVRKERMRQGRNYAPSAAAIDSQRIKKSPFINIETGIDGGKDFVPQTGRWQVERSFACLNFFKRLDKDHERIPESSCIHPGSFH